MANPMQFTIVSEVPLDSSGAFCATSVENSGESAVTASPQSNRNVNRIGKEFQDKKRGEQRQHKPDKNNAMVAIFWGPK